MVKKGIILGISITYATKGEQDRVIAAIEVFCN
jgi:hypothetical protein